MRMALAMYVEACMLIRANKLETVLSRDCWLVWPHHEKIFFMYMYMYVPHSMMDLCHFTKNKLSF